MNIVLKVVGCRSATLSRDVIQLDNIQNLPSDHPRPLDTASIQHTSHHLQLVLSSVTFHHYFWCCILSQEYHLGLVSADCQLASTVGHGMVQPPPVVSTGHGEVQVGSRGWPRSHDCGCGPGTSVDTETVCLLEDTRSPVWLYCEVQWFLLRVETWYQLSSSEADQWS